MTSLKIWNVVTVALDGNRLASDSSIIANSDGSFYDFNGGIRYGTLEELLSQRNDLTEEGDYEAPANRGDYKEKEFSLADEVARWSYDPEELDRKLIVYVPFFNENPQPVRNATRLAGNGEIAVMFRDSNKLEIIAVHYRTKVDDRKYEWRVLPTSDAHAFEALPANDDGYVYAVFGGGDYLMCRLLGLRYLAFGSDISVHGNKSKASEFERVISAGKKKPTTIRLIHDNDDSGRKVLETMKEKGLAVQPFDWKTASAFLCLNDTSKWDLRDISRQFASEGKSLDELYHFITDSRFYVTKGAN